MRSCFETEARPYLDRARALSNDPSRAAALAAMAMARASGADYGEAALLAVRAHLNSNQPTRATQVLEDALGRRDVPEPLRAQLHVLLGRTKP